MIGYTPYQIVVPLLSALAIIYAWSLMLRKKKTVWEVILWMIFWGVIAWIALDPRVLGYLSIITGIKSQGNAVTVTSIGILFFFVFYFMIRIEELEQRQAKLVRDLALSEGGLEQPKEHHKKA